MTPIKKISLSILLIIIAVFFAALMSVSGLVIASKARPTHFDYYWFWVTSRAVFDGESPYSPQITRVIQQGYFLLIYISTPSLIRFM